MTRETSQSLEPVRARRQRSRRTLRAAAPLLIIIIIVLVYIGALGGNVRTVVPGRVYRSAQLTGSISAPIAGNALGQVLDRYHIATVINLRGGSPKNRFYRDEVAECARRGIPHVDVPFSARFLPPPERLDALYATFDRATYPVLFHCAGGSDRTGLVATLYVNEYRHVPLDEAERSQLTWRYGHFAWGEAHAMNDFFDLYRESGAGMSLREWVRTRYPAIYAKSPLAMRRSPSDLAPSQPQPAAAKRPVSSGAAAGAAGG